ncbi:MAG: hypothetical protein HYW85_04835 [Deltaproteobacteria bacterium]|nr:hypothetical protein [Deltaproteobacteria bacterium]MBI3016834.1 hypothetical protein [Deltaproteobacteria bacterium]
MKIRFLMIVGLLISTLSFAEEPKQKEFGLSDLVGTWQVSAKGNTVTLEYAEAGSLSASWGEEKLQAVCDGFIKAKDNGIITENILLSCRSAQGPMGLLVKFLNKDQISTRGSIEDTEILILDRKK